MDKYGLFGYPLEHTFSPQIHNPAFESLGINAVYEVCQIPPDKFPETIKKYKAGQYKGFNITVPYKQKIIPFIDEIDPLAKKVNAVNTIKNVDGKWYGYNTDLYGFLLPLKNYLKNIKRVLVIGAGGAANAVCFALLDTAPIEHITITNRTIEKADVLKDRLNKEYTSLIETTSLDAHSKNRYDLIVNTTSVGMGKMADRTPFDIAAYHKPDTIVYDLIYNPRETLLLQNAKSQKLKAVNGLDMLIGQAAESFFIWTGEKFPDNVINKSIFYK